jgi:hypothetical protein
MVLMAAAPYLMSRAVDDGLVPGNMGALAWWTGVLFVVGAVNSWLSIMRHRTMTRLRDRRQLAHGQADRRADGPARRRAVTTRAGR